MVWMPLTMRQITTDKCMDEWVDVITPTMTITTDVLDFLGYEGADKEKQKNFRELLDRSSILSSLFPRIFDSRQ